MRAPRDEAASEPPPVSCESVKRVYAGGDGRGRGRERTEVQALAGVSLTVERGEMVAVTGASGSGKSTLLHLLAALDAPTDGTVRVAGTDTADLGEAGRARLRRDHVGVVFQRFHLLPSLSARSNVALPLVERGLGKRERHERADALLERVGLGDRLDHRPGELSGGEQQRVAVARALVGEPDLVVADEPTGELDTETGRAVLDLLANAADECAVVVASHDDRVSARAHGALALRDGRVVDGREVARSG